MEGSVMKNKTIIAMCLIAGILFVSGCTSIRVSQDYKPAQTFSDVKTYAWKSTKQDRTGDVRIDNPFNDERIRTAVDKTLSLKGFVRTTGNPDVYLSYVYSIQSKIASSSNGPVIGFGFGTGGRNSTMGFAAGVGNDVGEFDEGRLVIDLADGKTNELIWRGTSTSRVDTQASPEKMTRLLNTMVEKNLAQFPPGKK